MHPEGQGYYGPALHGFRASQPLHAQLLATLKTGDRADGHVSASKEWERGEMPSELARNITAYMNAHSRAAALAAARQPVFKGVRRLLDVGGGSAIFSIEMAKAWPTLRATVLEIAPVCVEADRYIAAAGVAERVGTKASNMFTDDWSGGHDAHFLSNIFHDWSDETCRLLARKSFASLPPGGIIILHEMLMDDDGCGPLATAAFSALMLLSTKGRQYSLPELRDFLEDAGFTDIESANTGSAYYSVVTARKPNR
jgi:ribosomal protein RSM22 (predicted rRNA methylase)